MRWHPRFVAIALSTGIVAGASAGEIPGVYYPWNDTNLGGVATLNGNVTISLPSNSVTGDVDQNFNLIGLHGSVELHGAIAADVDASGTGAFNTTVPLATIPLPIIPCGPNAYVAPIIGLLGNVSGNVQAGARFALVEQFASTISFTMDGAGLSVSMLGSPSNVHRFAPPAVSGATHADLEVSIIAGITFQIVIQNVLIGGPTVVSEFSIGAVVDPLANPWWDIDAEFAMSRSWVGPGVVLLNAPIGAPAVFDVADAGGPFLGISPSPSRWSRIYTLGSDENVTGVHRLRDGFLVTGNSAGVTNRTYLAKLGEDGLPIWEMRAQLLPFGSLRPVAVEAATNGDIVIAGQTTTSGGSRVDRFDAAGNPLWSKILVGPPSTNVRMGSMIATTNDHVIVAGQITDATETLPYVAELDANGVVVFAKQFDAGAASSHGGFAKVIATSDGGVLLVGRMDYTDAPFPSWTLNQPNAFAVKLDAAHNVMFATVLGTLGWDEAFAAAEGENGTFVIGGKVPSWVAPNVHAAVLVGLDSAGALEWSKVYSGESVAGSSGDTPYDEITDIATIDGGFVVTGNTGLQNNVRDSWLFGIDLDGVTTFFKSFRTDAEDQFAGVVPVGDDGYLAYGGTHKYDPLLPFPQDDFWIARTQVDGYLEFAPQFGIDCFNDKADWGHANAFASMTMPGSLFDLTLTTTAGAQGMDVVTSTTTLLTQ